MSAHGESVREMKIKLYFALSQKRNRSSCDEQLLAIFNVDEDILRSVQDRRDAWKELSKPLPPTIADVFDQA